MAAKGTDVDALGATVAAEEARTLQTTVQRVREGAQTDDALKATGVPFSVGSLDREIVLQPFGPYTRLEPLGEQGSMGFVAKGFNDGFRRWELLKFLRAEHASEPSRVRQFLREGRVLARLSHPNVVQVFAIYHMEGRPCLAMEFLRGRSLGTHVARHGGKLPIARWYEHFLDAARGLAAAHQVGLLHRDLKPDNLFVLQNEEGEPCGLKLIDFGLATAVRTRREGEARDSGLVADVSGGTPAYMAPELWDGAAATTASDVYSLGMTFFEAVAGRLPFEADTLVAALGAITSPSAYPSPRELRPDLPEPLARVLSRAIEKPRENRFAAAEDLVAALVAAWEGARPRQVPSAGPYRGLQPYTALERDAFFGRDVETAEVIERLRTGPGVVLVAPDDVGKTSLLRAGVVPAILDGALGNNLQVQAVYVEPGAHPLGALAAATAKATGAAEKSVLSFLRQDPMQLAEALRHACRAGSAMLIVVDPLERIVAHDVPLEEARAFCQALSSIVDTARPELRVAAAVRADRMDRLFSFESLRSLLTHGFCPLRSLRGEPFREALRGPARTAGFALEDAGVLEEIVAEVEQTASGLPLASFAMSRWWEKRDEQRRVLPTAAWRELGGVTGALVQHAEAVLEAMGRDLRSTAELLLTRLASADGRRLRARREDLVDPAAAGLDAAEALALLEAARIVREGFDALELAHDALVTAWPRLASLLSSSGEDREFRERVAAAAREWDAQGRPDGALWTDEQGRRLQAWLSATSITLTQTELAFAEAVRRRAARRKLLSRSVLASVAVVLVGFAGAAKSNEHTMARNLAEALKARDEAREAFRLAEAKRLLEFADSLVARDPAQALAKAIESYELHGDPALDMVAWRAHAAGLGHPVPAPSDRASAVGFSPDGRWLAVAGAEDTALVLGSQDTTRTVLGADPEQGSPLTALVFSPEGKRLALGTARGALAVWNVSGQGARELAACDGAVRGAWWRTQDELVLLCEQDGAASVWRWHPGKDSPALWVTGALPSSRITSAGGIVVRSDGSIAVLPPTGAQDLRVVAPPGKHAVVAVSMAADANVVVAGNELGQVRLWAPGARPEHATARVHEHARPVKAVHVAPDGSAVVSWTDTEDVRLTNVATGRTFLLEARPGAVAWLPARRALAISGRSHDILVVSVMTGEALGILRGPRRPVTALAADATARWLVAVDRAGAATAYVLEESLLALRRGPAPGACVLASDGSRLACLAGREVRIEQVLQESATQQADRLMQLRGGTGTRLLAVGARTGALLWADDQGTQLGDGKLELPAAPDLATVSERREVVAVAGVLGKQGWLATSPPMPEPRRPLKGAPRVLALSPSGRTLVVADATGALTKITTEDGTTQVLPPVALARGAAITALGISDDDTTLVVGTSSGQVGFGALDEGALRVVGHVGDSIACAMLARSGHQDVVVTRDGGIFLQDDAGRGGLLGGAVSAPIRACGRSRHEERYVFLSEDGSVRVRWLDLAPLAGARRAAAGWGGLPTERAW